MKERVHNTDLGAIHYWVADAVRPNAPWLVFLPGLTVDHGLYAEQIAYFESKANCLVWDAPAHGASRPFPLTFSLDDLARYLHEILEVEGVKRPALVGQSMGGYISQAYMDLFPGEVAGFVAIDSAPLQRSYYRKWELWTLKHTEGMYLSFPWRLLVAASCHGNAQTEKGRAYMRAAMESFGRREFCALAGHGFRAIAAAVEMDRPYIVDCPLLILCGERDRAGFVKGYTKAWSEREGVPVAWVPGAGHNSNTDNPAFVNEAIEAFVTFTERRG